MARTSGSGSRFASANLNDLYGKQALAGGSAGSGSGKSRYLHGGTTHGGMLVLARPVRTPANKPVKPAQPKLTVPAPVNLPSLRKEHAGNDPNITLVGGSGVSGWSKQQVQLQQQQSSSSSGLDESSAGDNQLKSNGWGVAQAPHLPQGPVPADGSPRPGKYTPPGARGSASPALIRVPSAVVLRGEDFPTLQAAAPFNPVPSQQRQRDSQQRQKDKSRDLKQQQQKLQQLSQNQLDKDEEEYKVATPSSPVLTLQPQSKQGSFRDDPLQRNSYFPLKENRKPNDFALRPGPLLHLNHTSNWADDERETASISKPPDWEEPSRYHGQPSFSRPAFSRDERSGNYRRDLPHGNDYGRNRDTQDFGWDREGHSGRNDRNSGRTGAFDRSEMDRGTGNSWGRERDSYLSTSFNRDSFGRESFFHKTGAGDRGRFGGRNGGFDLPVRIRSPYSDDAFMREFPELPNLDLRHDLKYRMRRKKDEQNEASFRDPERESFETELERVQKEQEQERQRKMEERERAIEFARKEQEERERLAREEEERQRKIEEEAREAAARAEQEALESVRKVEEAKRAREEEKRRMIEEEERRKENARRKLKELEERIAKREMDKRQQKNGPDIPESETAAVKGSALEDDDDRVHTRFASPVQSRMQQDQTTSRLRSPDSQGGYATYNMGRESVSRSGDGDRSRFASSSWRRDAGDFPQFPSFSQDHGSSMHSPGLRERRMFDDADGYYSLDGFPTGDGLRRDREWNPNGDPMRPSRTNNFMEPTYLDEERRWNRRSRESRPFSPPSPTSYGGSFDVGDGLPYGRLRQSLPKQPRVPPPPARSQVQRPSSSVFSGIQSTSLAVQEAREDISRFAAEPVKVQKEETVPSDPSEEEVLEDEKDSCGAVDAVEAESHDASQSQSSTDKQDEEEQEIAAESSGSFEVSDEGAGEAAHGVGETIEEPVHETVEQAEMFLEEQTKSIEVLEDGFHINAEGLEETMDSEQLNTADMGTKLSELVDSLVVVEKPEVEVGEAAAPTEESEKVEEPPKDGSTVTAEPPEAPALLPPPLQQPAQLHGLHQTFHQPQSFVPPQQVPLLDPRPRMQGPHSDRPMTLQFGLLPGTSLLQGSIPAIQIGSIQMPLQLHPPIGHHVMQPPPQFQFGQIGQQAPLLQSFTVHPQPMLQPSMMNVDSSSHSQRQVHGQQFRMQPHPERTFWAHQFGQGSQVIQPVAQEISDKEERTGDGLDRQSGDSKHQPDPHFKSGNAQDRGQYVQRKNVKGDENKESSQLTGGGDKARQATDLSSADRLFETAGISSAEPRNDEDDFIEVRSKRQLLNDRREKEKQVKSKSKYMKIKEQGSKPKNAVRAPSQVASREPAKNESSSLQNCSLDVVVSTARTRQVALSNAEVGFEKRTKSPQPSQINSLVPNAPAFPPIVSEGQNAPQANGPVAWGFGRGNQEAVSFPKIHLEEALKPARFEVPIPQQVPLSEHITSPLETAPSVATKDKGPGPAAAPGPINSLLAGEKIQFGAVTLPAFVSTIPWLGPSRSEGFLGGRKELQDENEVPSFGKKRSREHEEGSNAIDSEAEAEAAASAVAVAAISNDDYVHNVDQVLPSHGIIGSASTNKGSPASNGITTQNTRSSTQSSGMDDSINVSLPADLSVDTPLPLRGPHSGQLLPSIPGSFPGMEMGTLLERPGGPSWQPHHSGVDSFYGGPHSYTGPFINHGPIPSIPPHTLVYTSPFGGVGQFGQLGVSYMSPAHMPPVKQPDWKHTPVSTTSQGVSGINSSDIGNGMLYSQHSSRHLPHDPSVISVVPPGPFDMYRDMGFQVSSVDLNMQSQWSHVPGPHAPISGPIPGFPMQLRHPHPAYHMQHQNDMINDPGLTSAASSTPAESSDQFPDELGLGDSMSSTSDANSAFVVQQQTAPKPSSPVSSLPAGSKLRSRVVQPVTVPEVGSRPNSGNSGARGANGNSMPNFQAQSYVSTAAAAAASTRRPIGHQEKRNVGQHGGLSKVGTGGPTTPSTGTITGATTGWSNQNRKSQGRTHVGLASGDKSSSNSPAAKLKQVYVVKPSAVGLNTSDSSSSEIFTADARHM